MHKRPIRFGVCLSAGLVALTGCQSIQAPRPEPVILTIGASDGLGARMFPDKDAMVRADDFRTAHRTTLVDAMPAD